MIRNGYRKHRRLGQPVQTIFGQEEAENAAYAAQGNAWQAAGGTGPIPPPPNLNAQLLTAYGLPANYLTANQPPTTPITVTPGPVVPAASTPAPKSAPQNYSSQEIAGSFNYTADLETVQNEMNLYGDTWDNAQTIVNDLYSSGIVPGTVTPAIAFQSLTGLAAATTTATAPASLLSSVSTWPWYYWAGIAGAGLLLVGGQGKR